MSREQAAAVLHRANGRLKAAILMQRLDIEFDSATELLQQHDGKLRAVLDQPR
jgi:N-acetylmuramic acid 6-phosphate (MurNAc-6-P) etherase